ncbi:Fe-S cluster assembly protein SufD [Frateuria sp. STR12]|uniref:Fe-S cluster assembly protein SufD n=1 Tax=Frateuria hangzhouensis TaxID=2995589 RepID=UPI002260A5DF|nr:Fe-S cluster assembly protein SufD [Frateuria sp. STR12]MCX7514705.1 Fe-S cluster assembly protein SufD [Frateuria sp. STR12]
MNQPARPPFVAALAEAPLPASGVAWLDKARRENLDAFVAAGLPDTRVEAWKYTALRALSQRSFAAGDAQALSRDIDPALLALAGIEGPALVFVNGVYRADLSMLDALPAGVDLQPLSHALAADPESLRFTLSRHYREPGDAFARLNGAFAHDGAVLRVAAGAKISVPLRLVFVGAAAGAEIAWHVRHLVELGEGAELTLIEQHLGAGEQAHLGTQLGDVTLHADATLHHVGLQQAGAGSSLVRRSHYRLGARAQTHLHALELGGTLARHDLRAELVGDAAGFHGHGAFLPDGRQHMDIQLAIGHQARNTVSSSTWRGVASGRGRGVFRGAIVVNTGADGADAVLGNKNLLLSPQAEIDTKPELEIYADEVKAAHGATVGQLDERASFYLRSRGIPEPQARTLLTTAFARAPFESLASERLREHIDQLLLARLPA